MSQVQAYITVDSAEIDALVAAGFKNPVHAAVQKLTVSVKDRAKYWLDQLIYKRSVPWKRTRALQKSIVSKTLLNVGEVTVKSPYGEFIEFGTRPHTIRPKTAKVLAFPVYGAAAAKMKGKRIGKIRGALHTKNGSFKGSMIHMKTGNSTSQSGNAKFMFARIVRHPGTKPYPFMRNAVADVRNTSLQILTELVDNHIAKNKPPLE